MAEKPEQKAAEKAGKREHRSHMPLMAIVGIVLILNVLIVGKVFMGGKGGASAAKESQEVGKKLPLDEFLVNLADPGTEHYLKVTMALGLSKQADEKKIEEELAPIKDAVISVLSNSKRDEIGTEAGKTSLKEEIKARLNKRLGGHKIVEVYFTAFATQ
jgi:flagellar basal body-associated protein FliL